MKFDIVDPKVQAKKKQALKKKSDREFAMMVGLLLVALILLAIYYSTMDTKTVTPPTEPKVIQQSRLKVVNENSNERPIAVMIDNNVGNSSQAGLQDSYLNYEILVEGGLTRIMAIYKDKEVNLIGPVRSARHYFLDYAMESDAVYAHYGWSPYAQRDISNLDINNINGMTDSSPYARDTSLKAPHNVFTSTTKLRNYFSNKSYEQESSNWRLLNYSYAELDLAPVSEDEALESNNNSARVANEIKIEYSSNQIRSYGYDENKKYYLRFMNNNPHLDKTTNEQLHYKNIIIMKINSKVLDREGRLELETTGSGEGYFITNGGVIDIKWSKDSRSSKTIYSYSNGDPIRVNDGNTFIQIVPINSNIVIN